MKKTIIISLMLLTFLLTACSNSIADHTTIVGKMGDLSITDLRSTRTLNNLLLAQATFHNDGNSAKTGFYRCQFYDTNNMQVGDVQVWQPITIYPNEDQTIKCMSTQVEAVNFKVEFSADGNNVSVYNYK